MRYCILACVVALGYVWPTQQIHAQSADEGIVIPGTSLLKYPEAYKYKQVFPHINAFIQVSPGEEAAVILQMMYRGSELAHAGVTLSFPSGLMVLGKYGALRWESKREQEAYVTEVHYELGESGQTLLRNFLKDSQSQKQAAGIVYVDLGGNPVHVPMSAGEAQAILTVLQFYAQQIRATTP